MSSIPLIKPYIDKALRKRVLDVLNSGHLTEGAVTAELEAAVATFTGARHCIATTSCTTGLEIALRACGIGKGDEVILPAFTYPATAHVVAIVGAIPVFVDVHRQTMLIDYDRLDEAISKRTKAIVPVSLFGNPLNYDRLNGIKRKHDLVIIEDAACALGSSFREVPTGRHADISVFSLHPRKFITTGEGGLITTDHPDKAKWIRSYKRFGMRIGASHMLFESMGTNSKLSDILAAVGLMQMKQIELLMTRRLKQAGFYLKLLKNMPGVTLPLTTPQGKHSYQSFCIFVHRRDRVMKQMRAMGIEAQIGSYCLPEQPAYRGGRNCKIKSELKGSRYAFKNSLVLPLYHQLKQKDQQRVVAALKLSMAKTKE
jgi:dTDP-4-amino-4,6-dideoxygalactose transaminase